MEKGIRGFHCPPFEGLACQPYRSGWHSVAELTPASSHSVPQRRGWVPPRELAEQRQGVIPGRVRVVGAALWRQSIKCQHARVGTGACGNPRARRTSPKGCVSPRARRTSLEGGVSPRARRTLPEGGVSPRARRTSLEGALRCATLVGRGGHHGVDRVARVC
jgi:hypothetical protein